MKRIYFFVIIVLINSHFLSAQNLDTYYKAEVGINGLNLALELPIDKRITIEPAIGLGPSYDMDNHYDILMDKIGYHWALLEPSFHGSLYAKYFHKIRGEKNNSSWANAGNFFGLKVKYVSMSLSSPQYYSNILITNLNWGGQSNIGKHWIYSYSLGLGYGYNMDNSDGVLYPALELKIGYILPFFTKKRS